MSYLKEAFREAARREFSMIPEEEEIAYEFSPKFHRKMRRLLRAEAYGYWKYINTAAKRVAIAAAILVMLLTSAMAIKPIRERVIQFFVEVYEEYFEIRFGKEEKDDIIPTSDKITRYAPNVLPYEYSQTNFIESAHLLWTRWDSKDGGRIVLSQEPGNHETLIDNKGDYPYQIIQNNVEIRYQLSNNMDIYIWVQNGYIFRLTIYDELSVDQSLEIISSLEAKQ